MDIDDLSHMYAEIVLGTTKADSRYVASSPDASGLWDKISAQVEEARAKGMMLDMINEVPPSVPR